MDGATKFTGRHTELRKWIEIRNKDVNVNHAARNRLATAANDKSNTQCLWDYALAYKVKCFALWHKEAIGELSTRKERQ
jgi:hypothetical protein